MNRTNLFTRITAIALALLALCSCAKKTDEQSESQPQSSSGIHFAASQQQPNLEYTTVDLTTEGLAVEQGTAYYLPMGEGKYIPAADTVWMEYLDDKEFSALESFSMPFVAVDKGDTALVYVMENPYRASIGFSCEPNLTLQIIGEESTLAPEEVNTVRVYTTENSAVAVSNAYKSYLSETREILTLVDKAEQNPNIAKLYGAPHIYLWGDFALSEEDVKWQALTKSASSPALAHVSKVLANTDDGDGQFTEMLAKIAGQDYVDKYQRSVLLRGLSTALTQEDFYDNAVFTKSNTAMQALLAKPEQNPAALLELNKQALFENLPSVFAPVEEWYNYDSTDIITEMKQAGIDSAWIGLNSWEQGYHPQLVESAINSGYLIGPYDSYHSIHKPGKEQWNTAAFPDTSLYENATVMNKNGEKISGFQNTGRKLNSTLAMPSVKQRVGDILNTGVQFNSWFVDCDATGEVYDDYSPAHPTTKQQDVLARLERLDYLTHEKDMVIGSEGGNDFAANSIAFAHGIELQSFSWMDEDMKTNKESEYYLGKYYSAKGGVPEKFSKPIPVKEKYRKLFLDMSYQIPLYKLVYNNSVITSYHWDWSTFKITSESENRMLREILYNVPPLYHLDRTEWDTYKDKIIKHNAVWAPFSQKAIMLEMTAFECLSEDRLVQMTRYGDDLQAVANFSNMEYLFEGNSIPPQSVLIMNGESKNIYTP